MIRHPAKWMMALAAATTIATAARMSLADDPSTDHPRGSMTRGPGGGPTTRPGDRDGRGGNPRWGNDGGKDQTPPTPEEWSDIEEFMQQNSPIRLEMYHKIEKQLNGDNRLERLRTRIAGRYRGLQQIRERDPDMYEFAFKQFRIEDQVLDTMSRIRNAGDSPALQDELKMRMQTFVENALNERAARLGKLKELVAKEETNLAADRGNMPEMMDRQRDRFDREMKRLIDFNADVDSKAPTTAPSDEKR